MAELTLEERVEALEQKVAVLATKDQATKKRNWLSTVLGRFKGNADYAEVARAGQEMRATGRLADDPPAPEGDAT